MEVKAFKHPVRVWLLVRIHDSHVSFRDSQSESEKNTNAEQHRER